MFNKCLKSAYAPFVLIVATPPWNRVWQKQGFCEKHFVDCGIKSETVYAAKATKAQRIFFAKPVANRNAMEVQTLLLAKPVKKFASDKDEGVFLKLILIKSGLQCLYNLK
jgi:hypothetical protein